MSEVKVIEYTIDDTGFLGVNCISLVENPAIEVDFVAMSKQKQKFARVEGDRMMLYGPAMIPDQLIYREDAQGTPYYCKYSKATIEKIAQEYLRRNMHHNSNIEHQLPITGICCVESWIKEGAQDKSNNFGFDLPDGTWFVGMKVMNDQVWEEVKNGNVKGFSIEGFFTELSDQYLEIQEVERLISEFEQEITRAM